MAKPIKDTPVLVGGDAARFEEAVHSVVPAADTEKEQAKTAFEYFSTVATFGL